MAGSRIYIAIAGNIGAGKSTLVDFLCKTYGVSPFFEPNDENPYLADFYQNMDAWAFHSQVFFLAHKFRIHQELDRTPGIVVQDRTIYEDAEIFCTNLYNNKNIAERDYQTYMELYRTMKTALQPPDLMIYLRCSVRAIRRRIRGRGRASEQDIPVTYLRNLNKLYEGWFERYDSSPKLVWDSERMDYLTDIADQIEFRKSIEAFL